MRPEEIGDLLGTDPESVIVAREAALEQLAHELGAEETSDLDDLRSRLGTLPSEVWTPPAEDERPALTVVSNEPGAAPERPARRRQERRSRRPLLLALLAAAAVVLVIVLASGGGDDENAASSSAPSKPQSKPAKPTAKPAPGANEVKLTAVAGAAGASGSASLVDGGKRLRLDVTGLPQGAYEVWLYDSVIDARSIGRQTGTKIALDAKLPANATHYRYVDVSREPSDGNPNHSGESVLRVPLAKLSP
jgi:hypothetical protein